MMQLEDLISKYWNLAYREGFFRKTHDKEEGGAQETLNLILEEIKILREDAARYRWIRSRNIDGDVAAELVRGAAEEHLDIAIDKEINYEVVRD